MKEIRNKNGIKHAEKISKCRNKSFLISNYSKCKLFKLPNQKTDGQNGLKYVIQI